MSEGYNWEGMEFLSIDEIKKEYEDNGLEGCFILHNDGTEALIDIRDFPTWEAVLEKLKEVDGIGIENQIVGQEKKFEKEQGHAR